MIGPVCMISADRSGARLSGERRLRRCPPPPPSPATCGRCCAGAASGGSSPPGWCPRLGDGAFQVGLASVFFFSPERAATASAAAAAFAVGILPYTIVGPFAGVLLDRWRRRQILLVANAVRAVLVVGAAALVAGHAVGPPLYLVVLPACRSTGSSCPGSARGCRTS